MSAERCRSIPCFTLYGVTFECWALADGRLEWRSTCGRFAAGRDGAEFWAMSRGRLAGSAYASLKIAMGAAIHHAERDVA